MPTLLPYVASEIIFPLLHLSVCPTDKMQMDAFDIFVWLIKKHRDEATQFSGFPPVKFGDRSGSTLTQPGWKCSEAL